MRWWMVAGVVAMVAVVRGAAGETAEPLSLAYEAPAGCPDRDAFFAQVTGRTTKVRPALAADTARAVHVRIARTGRGFIGHLHFEVAGSTSSPRVVEGATCIEVADALGLVAALAVDPAASIKVVATPDSGESTPDAGLAGSSDGGAADAASSNDAVPAADRDTATGTRDGTSTVDTGDDGRQRGALRIAAGAMVEGSSLAGFVVAPRLFGELAFERDSILSPSFRISLARSFGASREAAVGSADLAWTTGAVEACPIAVRPAASVALRPCVDFAFGVLSANGSGVATARERSRPWLAADAFARLTWFPHRLVGIDLDAGAVVPFTRETFFFEPGIDVYEAPAAAFFARIGAGLRFR